MENERYNATSRGLVSDNNENRKKDERRKMIINEKITKNKQKMKMMRR